MSVGRDCGTGCPLPKGRNKKTTTHTQKPRVGTHLFHRPARGPRAPRRGVPILTSSRDFYRAESSPGIVFTHWHSSENVKRGNLRRSDPPPPPLHRPPHLLPGAQPLALRRSATFQQPISFFIVTDRWRKTRLPSTTRNKRYTYWKNFGVTSVNLLARVVSRTSPMLRRGMFNLLLTSINRRFFLNPGDILFFFGPPRCRVCCQIMRLDTHGAAASS